MLEPRSAGRRSWAKRTMSFTFEDFQEQGEFSDLDGLRVDIDAEDVIEKDAFTFGDVSL